MPPELEVPSRIVQEVANATDTPMDELPALFGNVDPEALDQLFDETANDSISVTFHYADCEVTVLGHGREPTIAIEPLVSPIG